MKIIRKRGEAALTWPTRTESKRWGIWQGGYLALGRGVRFLQRFAEWGVASIGQQKEFIARFELNWRRVETSSMVHVELFNPDEARLWLLQFRIWKGMDVFFVVNFGIRLTSSSRTVRAQRMRELMLAQAKKEQAERLAAQRRQNILRGQLKGHPWPAHAVKR